MKMCIRSDDKAIVEFLENSDDLSIIFYSPKSSDLVITQNGFGGIFFFHENASVSERIGAEYVMNGPVDVVDGKVVEASSRILRFSLEVDVDEIDHTAILTAALPKMLVEVGVAIHQGAIPYAIVPTGAVRRPNGRVALGFIFRAGYRI